MGTVGVWMRGNQNSGGFGGERWAEAGARGRGRATALPTSNKKTESNGSPRRRRQPIRNDLGWKRERRRKGEARAFHTIKRRIGHRLVFIDWAQASFYDRMALTRPPLDPRRCYRGLWPQHPEGHFRERKKKGSKKVPLPIHGPICSGRRGSPRWGAAQTPG